MATNSPKPSQPKKVVARGKSLDRTESELDDMTSAEAMMALAEEAADDWRENAPPQCKTLLDGEERP